MKRWFACLTALILLCATASAGASGLGGALDAWLGEEVRLEMSLELTTLTPYGEADIGRLNAALGHMSMAAALEGESTAMSLMVDGESLMTLSQYDAQGVSTLTTSLLPNRTLVSAASALDVLFDNPAAQESAFDALDAIAQVEACYQELTDAIVPFAEQKKANYKIADVGTSRWSRIARLTTDQSAMLSPLIAQVLGCGMDAAYRGLLEGMTYDKGFIVGLYQTEEGGDDLAVYIKGGVTFADGTERQLAYQWAFSTDEDGVRTDTYKFELTTDRSPSDNRVISATYRRGADGLPIEGQSSCAIKVGGVTDTTTLTHDISLEQGALTGSVVTALKHTESGESETLTTTLVPALTLEDGTLSGSVTVEQGTGKNPTLAFTLRFSDTPAQVAAAQPAEQTQAYDPMPKSSLQQNVEVLQEVREYLVGEPPIGYTRYEIPQTMQTYDLDAADEAQLADLVDEAVQRLAGRLLVALASLGGEDAALLEQNMSEEDYAAFLTLLNGL